MIAVKLQGRLGNQLFQYAFAYAVAKKLNTGFYIDQSIDYLLLDEYFSIKQSPTARFEKKLFSIRGFKNIFSYYLRKKYYKLLVGLYNLKDKDFDNYTQPALQLSGIKSNLIYTGYFQSQDYFADCKDDIRRMFSIKKHYQASFNDTFCKLPKAGKYVVIHIRRGDYVSYDYSLPNSYYHNAIKEIHTDDNFYVVVSDDPEFARHEFNYLENVYFSENDHITDLQFLINADICILSASSFSWWGAWLNNKANKIVMAPKLWLGFNKEEEYPIGISNNVDIKWVTA